MRSGAAVALAFVLALSAACGANAEAEAFERLERQVAAVRGAAEAGEISIAAERLGNLRQSVADYRQQGLIGEPRTQQILAAAAQVEAHLALAGPQETSPPPPPSAPDPAPDVQLEPPGSNSGQSVRGAPGQRGEPGRSGEGGRSGSNRNDDDDDDDD